MKKFFKALGAALALGFCGGYVAYAETIPGWDEPFNIELYYSPTEISWEDSPSAFTIRDLAAKGGNVIDYTRLIKSVLFADNFNQQLANTTNKSQIAEMNSTPFDSEVFAETAEALKTVSDSRKNTTKNLDIQQVEQVLRQGDDGEFENFNPDLNNAEKFLLLDSSYKNYVEGASVAAQDTEKIMEAADKVLNHTNIAQGDLQVQQARNELLALLANELARKNALEANMAQMQALYQAAEYDDKVRSAYFDSITKFDVADPYDSGNYELLESESGYKKPQPVGMPDFK